MQCHTHRCCTLHTAIVGDKKNCRLNIQVLKDWNLMALVQRIMVLHNASIDIQRKEGHGTKFIISFTNNK